MSFPNESASSFEQPFRNKEIIIYTSKGCHKCEVLKHWLKNRDTDFTEKNLENVDVMADLVMRNVVVLAAPALEVEGEVYTIDQVFNGDGSIRNDLPGILKGS